MLSRVKTIPLPTGEGAAKRRGRGTAKKQNQEKLKCRRNDKSVIPDLSCLRHSISLPVTYHRLTPVASELPPLRGWEQKTFYPLLPCEAFDQLHLIAEHVDNHCCFQPIGVGNRS